jgi:hypothetical protein
LTLLLVYVPGLNTLFTMEAVPVPWLLTVPASAAAFVGVDLIRRWLVGRSERSVEFAG